MMSKKNLSEEERRSFGLYVIDGGAVREAAGYDEWHRFVSDDANIRFAEEEFRVGASRRVLVVAYFRSYRLGETGPCFSVHVQKSEKVGGRWRRGEFVELVDTRVGSAGALIPRYERAVFDLKLAAARAGRKVVTVSRKGNA